MIQICRIRGYLLKIPWNSLEMTSEVLFPHEIHIGRWAAHWTNSWAPFRCNLELLHTAIWANLPFSSSRPSGDLINDLRLVQNAPYPPSLMSHGRYMAEPVIWSQKSSSWSSWSSYIGLYGSNFSGSKSLVQLHINHGTLVREGLVHFEPVLGHL